MIQRDYILRMIEEFRRLIGVFGREAMHLSETDLTARLMRGEATQVVRDKMLFLIRLFKEAGDAALADGNLPRSEREAGLAELKARRVAFSR